MQFSKRLWTVVLPQINCLSKLHFWWQQMFWKMAFCSTFKPRFFPPPQKSAKECIILRKKKMFIVAHKLPFLRFLRLFSLHRLLLQIIIPKNTATTAKYKNKLAYCFKNPSYCKVFLKLFPRLFQVWWCSFSNVHREELESCD